MTETVLNIAGEDNVTDGATNAMVSIQDSKSSFSQESSLEEVKLDTYRCDKWHSNVLPPGVIISQMNQFQVIESLFQLRTCLWFMVHVDFDG